MSSLSDAQNIHYRTRAADWTLAEEFYKGEPRGRLQRGHFESKASYQKRLRRAHIFPYTRQIISRLSDQILLRADEVDRELGPVPQSFLTAAGTGGESHDLVLKRLADYLLLYGEAWLQVLPQGPQLRVLSPLSVPRWTSQEVMVKGQRRTADSIFDKEESQTTYTVHTAQEWTTYVEDKESPTDRKIIDQGVYSADGTDTYFVTESGEPAPPFVRVQMPWDAVLGVEIAKTHLEMYRLESELDSRLQTALTSTQRVTKGLDSDSQTAFDDAQKKGASGIHLSDKDSSVEPVEVPTNAVEMAEKRLASKETTLYETAYQTLQQEASSSATEAVVRDKAAAAATATLASTIQSAETSALRLIAQAGDMIQYAGPRAADPGIGYRTSWTDIDWEGARVDLAGE